nr:MAG TPA: hypothetical protein [Caudoviricetes sp.]
MVNNEPVCARTIIRTGKNFVTSPLSCVHLGLKHHIDVTNRCFFSCLLPVNASVGKIG